MWGRGPGAMSSSFDERPKIDDPVTVPRRNDPCPCGSGRRYKHCHGAPNAADAQLARAFVQRDAGDFAGALATIDGALVNAPEHARLLNIQGLLRLELHDLDGVLA